MARACCATSAASALKAWSRSFATRHIAPGASKDWIKSKCSNRQEFVVAGYVPSTVSNKAIGSLVLGYFDDGKLIHAGRVGTGFSHKLAEDLFRRLDAMSIPKSPFAKKLSAVDARRVRFVRPELVAEVEFRTGPPRG